MVPEILRLSQNLTRILKKSYYFIDMYPYVSAIEKPPNKTLISTKIILMVLCV